MQEPIEIVLITLLCLAVLEGITQTKYRGIPIESNDPFKIEIWAFNEDINTWGWYDITQTELEYAKGWYFNEEINIELNQIEILHFRFITGNEKLNCREVTKLTLHGGHEKNKVKDKPDLRVKFEVNGIDQVLGNEIDKP